MPKTLQELEERIAELESGIRYHRDQRGDDRCFLDDDDLYRLLPDHASVETQLPPKEHFLKSCEKFWECRQRPGELRWEKTPPLPEWKDVAPEVVEWLKELKDFFSVEDVRNKCIALAGKVETIVDAGWESRSDTINDDERIVVYRRVAPSSAHNA